MSEPKSKNVRCKPREERKRYTEAQMQTQKERVNLYRDVIGEMQREAQEIGAEARRLRKDISALIRDRDRLMAASGAALFFLDRMECLDKRDAPRLARVKRDLKSAIARLQRKS